MKLKKIIAKSLQLRIIMLLLLSVIPPALGALWILDNYAKESLIELAQEELKQDIEQIKRLIISGDNARREDLLYINVQPEVVSLQAPEVTSFLQDFVKIRSWQGNLVVADINGKVIGRSNTSNFPSSEYTKKWVQKAKTKNIFREIIPGTTYIDTEDCLVAPIRSADKTLIGIVSECISLMKISQDIKHLAVIKNDGRVRLFSPEGWVYADTAKVQERLENLKNYPEIEKVKILDDQISFIYSGKDFISILPFKLKDDNTIWMLILEHPQSSFLKTVVNLGRLGLFLIFAIGLIVTFVSWKVVRHVTAPILELTKAAKEVANENLDYIIDITQQDELGTLAISFNNMTQRLKNLIDKEVKDAIYQTELEKGRQIQQDFLPPFLPEIPGWRVGAMFQPARWVSGDFYDVFFLKDDYVGLVIGDVCDKGVGAAMFMGLFRSLLRIFSGAATFQEVTIIVNDGDKKNKKLSDEIPAKFLNAVYLTNKYIATEHSSMMMFATLFFGILDTKTGDLFYVNGGHEPLYIVNSEGIKHQLKATGAAVGIMPQSTFTVKQVKIATGEVLIGYTDGVTDARSPSGEFFSRKKLETLLIENSGKSAEILERINNELMAHIANSVQFDDITMLAVRRI